jgi:phage-related protein
MAKPQVQDIHIQEEASNVKRKKPQVCMRDSLFLHLFTYKTEEATDLKWKAASTRYSHTEKKLQI